MSLLGSIDKKPYQAYVIEHGIERVHIQIPLKEARAFEASFAESISNGDDTKNTLLSIVSEHGGSIRAAKRSS